jgi:Ca-activated chloride channel family protein
MMGTPLHFAHPEFAPILWGWLVVVLGLVVLERRGSGALDRLVGIALQDRLVDRPSSWRRWVRVALIGVAGTAMAMAIMQPQMGERYVSTPRVGAEIMIALDVSRSMLADDAKPSRLERAKAEIRDLLSYLGDDYVGLIAFAGRASILSPMTPDKSFLRLALDRAGPHSVSRGGTRLAEPIRRAVAGLGEPGPAQRALILITDGEDHDSFALDAAKAAAEAGIKIIAIGFGDENGSPIYIRDPQTGARSQVRDGDGNGVVSRLNGDLLRQIALATDGAFVPAGTGVLDLASIYDAHIAQLTRGQLDERGRTIRDEVYQPFLLFAFICLVAGIFITRGPRSGASSSPVQVAAMVLGFLAFAGGPQGAQAQLLDPAAEPESVDAKGPSPAPSVGDLETALEALGSGAESGRTVSEVVVEDARTRFNRGNEALAQGEGVAATSILRAARRDAPDDPELRYGATYNLGIAAVMRADSFVGSNRKESLAALHEATDWFREAASMRPEEAAPRHNLDVALRRALILADEIAKGEEGNVEAELDALVEGQRARVAASAGLLEASAGVGEADRADALRSHFRNAATDQRVLLTEADELAERIVREREAIAGTPEESRSPEDALRAVQLDGVLVYLDGAINRMGQTRRQLRQQRAERAYRRASGALGELKRARDQLRDPVQQIGVLLQEVGALVGATNALEGSSRAPSLSGAEPQETAAKRPAFLTSASLEEESRRIENRVRDLGVRLKQAAIDAEASEGAPPPADPTASASQPSEADRTALREALGRAAPMVFDAGIAMEGATTSIGAEGFDVALSREAEAGGLLADAQEVFFDLRQLLDVTHRDEEQIVAMATVDQEELPGPRDSFAPLLQQFQKKNVERSERLGELLLREREKQLAEVAAQAQGASPAADPAVDPMAQENERFEIAEELLTRAVAGMEETRRVLLGEAFEGGQANAGQTDTAADWEVVAEASTRARDRLAELQILFFTLIEHLQKLARDQINLNDRTQDAIALAVTEGEDGRGPQTKARATVLAEEQAPLGDRAGGLADALLAQSEAMAAAPEDDTSDPASAPSAQEEEEPHERMRRAAEHVVRAQLAMGLAGEGLVDDEAELDPVRIFQDEAVTEILAALELLSPPPPPEEEGQDDESEDQEGESESESPPEPESGQDEGAQANENEEASEEEVAEDPSELLQGVRDREAERRRDQERDQQNRRSQPVDRDW